MIQNTHTHGIGLNEVTSLHETTPHYHHSEQNGIFTLNHSQKSKPRLTPNNFHIATTTPVSKKNKNKNIPQYSSRNILKCQGTFDNNYHGAV